MCVEFLDGTIRYPAAGFETVEVFFLSVAFSDGVAGEVTIHDLERLQTCYRDQLEICPGLEPGSLSIRQQIVACGPESALRQAKDLQERMYVCTGLLLNLAESASLKERPR